MGLLYEKERRVVGERDMPDVKEADELKRAAVNVALVRDDDDGEWSDLDLAEENALEDDLDIEDSDDEIY